MSPESPIDGALRAVRGRRDLPEIHTEPDGTKWYWAGPFDPEKNRNDRDHRCGKCGTPTIPILPEELKPEFLAEHPPPEGNRWRVAHHCRACKLTELEGEKVTII